MKSAEVKIMNPYGLQLDAAGAFCDLAMKFESKIHFFYRGDNESNAKSVLSILGAGIRANEVITIEADGPDEAEAIEAITNHLLGGN